MERFTEETASDLAENYARYMAAHVWGDDPNPMPEPLRCGSCGAECPELERCTWDTDLMVGTCCAIDPEMEPECECRMDGDAADASRCELHNPSSPWNVRRRRLEIDPETGCTESEMEAPLPRRMAMLSEAGCTRDEALAFIREVA